MIEAFYTSLLLVFRWPSIGFLMLGVLIGVWLGAVPGLSGIVGLVILLPFTFNMDPVPAFALLLGMLAVTSTSDTIASVMLGIPGTAASQATILDGYPLAQKGHAARAFGAAFTVSAFGGVFGALVLAVSLPLILPIILAFGSPEIFMLGMLGLTMVGTLSGRSILKGLIVALLGLWMGTIGYAEAVAVPRYWFGVDYLLDGLPLIPVVLGLFAIPELMELATKNISIARVPKDQAEGGGTLEGIKEAVRNWWLVLRCSMIGTFIGILPGLGPSIVDWVAYGYAVQSAKDKSLFGQGDIRGVIAPESANNAIRGGALIPTIVFGIPGSLATAILLGALIMHGLKPGPEMLTTHLDVTFSMVWSIVVANIVAAGLLMIWSKQVAKVAFVPGHIIVPGVIVFVFMGAWLGGASMGDWITCLSMGIVGFIMKRGGWPRPPLILALILGPILENAFQVSVQAYQGYGWLGRPIVLVVLALLIVLLYFSTTNIIRNQRVKKSPSSGGEGSERNPVISFPFAIMLGVLFVGAGIEAFRWPALVNRFPLMISAFGVPLVMGALHHDTVELMGARREAGSMRIVIRLFSQKALLSKALAFFGYLICVILVSFAIGQKITLPLFIGLYLWRWGGYGRLVSLGYAVLGWIFIVGFYDQVMHLFWYPFWLSSWLQSIMPAWMPSWFFI